MKRILTAIAVLFAACATVFAQGGYQVKGVVKDAIGPVIGASVIEQGTSNGVSTGLDGDFTLTVSNANATIEVSCIGYATQTFTASAVPATIVLAEDAEFLDDVVVIGYGTVKKTDMTGSVVAVKNDEINRGAISSPAQAMMGKVSGMLVTPASGSPGEGATIRIRGAASLNANNDPLIVIDGVPVTREGGAGMGDPLASVNPNDIESFSVLKDASATAIYGSRASNGVIIITTKKGSKGALQLDASASFSVKQNTKTIKMMTGDELRNYVSEVYGNDSAAYAILGNANTDWQKQIYRPAVGTDVNMSLRGGKVVPFRVSFGANYDQGTIKGGDNERYNLDLNLSPKFFQDHLSINANVKGVYQNTNWGAGAGAIGNAMRMDPTKPIYAEDGSYFNWYDGGNPNSMAGINPLSQIYERSNFNRSLRSIGNFQADYKVHGFEDLRFNLNLGYDVAKNHNENHNILGTYMAALSSPDYAYISDNFNSNTLLEFYADYNHEFKHSNLDVMAGYSWQHNYVKYDGSTYYNKPELWKAEDLFQKNPTSAKEYYLLSFFGRVNYSILSRYLFTATVRADASSRFAKGNQWGIFPSAAFAWNVKNENFLRNVNAVSALKLRLGWGRTGQQDIGDDYYPAMALYRQETTVLMQYNMGGQLINVLAPQAYNKNLKWETTETWNAGLDFGFINDRITGTVEVYYRNTFDLLNVAPTALGQNFSNTTIQNIGDMVNKGVELSLNFVPVETDNWHWSIGGNVTFQDTKITKLTAEKVEGFLGTTTGASMGSNTGFSSVHREGFAPYTFYLFEQLYDKNGAPVYAGLVDRDGDGVITDADRYVTGYSPIPSMYFGLNTRLSYKNWDFSINGHGSLGNYAINKVRKGYASSLYIPDQVGKHYIDNLSSQYLIPGWNGGTDSSNQAYSDLWVENASFFKIDDINLGYTFKLNNEFFKTLRLAASVQNVCTFTKYSGIDPELTAADGVDNTIVPRPRFYTIRLNINF